MTEPPVLTPGQPCAHCGGKRNLDKLKPLYRDAMESDAFCSSTCCRAWWGVSLPSLVPGRAIESRA